MSFLEGLSEKQVPKDNIHAGQLLIPSDGSLLSNTW